ncbi:MAG: hypothetical protein ABJA98_33935 [Acidobacteriota bacterium]
MARVRSVICLAALLAILVLVTADQASAQCAMCRRALDSPEGRQMIGALRSGILILLAAPFAVFGAVTGLVVRMNRSRDSREGEG